MVMRSSWKGSLSFGLMNVPIKLVKATEDKDVSFNQIHIKDKGRVRLKRVCGDCGIDLEYGDIGKGYELAEGLMIPITDEELDSLQVDTLRTVELSTLVAGLPDPLSIDSSYFVLPEKVAGKPLALIASALTRKKKSLIGKITIRHKERPCVIWMRQGNPILSTMRFADEIRDPELDLPEIGKKEVDLAIELLETIDAPVLEVDHFREAAMNLIQMKSEGKETPKAALKKNAEPPKDLMDSLRASINAVKANGVTRTSVTTTRRVGVTKS